MKRVFKILLLLLTLSAILCTPSCKRDKQSHRSEQIAKQKAEKRAKRRGKSFAEKFANKFAIESIDGFEGSFNSGWKLNLHVRNDSAYSPRIIAAKANLYSGESRMASVTLTEPVEIPKRSVTSLALPLKLSLSNPILALSLLSRFKQGNFEGLQANLSLTFEIMGVTRTIEIGRTDINAILTKLGHNI